MYVNVMYSTDRKILTHECKKLRDTMLEMKVYKNKFALCATLAYSGSKKPRC